MNLVSFRLIVLFFILIFHSTILLLFSFIDVRFCQLISIYFSSFIIFCLIVFQYWVLFQVYSVFHTTTLLPFYISCKFSFLFLYIFFLLVSFFDHFSPMYFSIAFNWILLYCSLFSFNILSCIILSFILFILVIFDLYDLVAVHYSCHY